MGSCGVLMGFPAQLATTAIEDENPSKTADELQQVVDQTENKEPDLKVGWGIHVVQKNGDRSHEDWQLDLMCGRSWSGKIERNFFSEKYLGGQIECLLVGILEVGSPQ